LKGGVKKEEGKWEREEFAGKNFSAKKIPPHPPSKNSLQF
jgi:hypothetical protein